MLHNRVCAPESIFGRTANLRRSGLLYKTSMQCIVTIVPACRVPGSFGSAEPRTVVNSCCSDCFLKMTTSVQSDSTRFYESTVTAGLIIQLRSLLGIQVTTEPGQHSYARRFHPSDLPVWPMEYGDEAEVDFFGKCQHKEAFPQLLRATNDNNVFLTTSAIAVETKSSPSSGSNKPKRSHSSFFGKESARYVVGEVLYGGRKSLIPKKAQQLERAVRFAFILKYGSDYLEHQPRDLWHMVLGAVECAIIVHQENTGEEFFQHVTASAYPLLAIVKDTGRLVFVHNTLVPTRLIAMLREETADQREQLETHRTIIAEQESQLARQQELLEEQGERLAAQEAALAELQRQYRELLMLVVGSGKCLGVQPAVQGPSEIASATQVNTVATFAPVHIEDSRSSLPSRKRQREEGYERFCLAYRCEPGSARVFSMMCKDRAWQQLAVRAVSGGFTALCK